MTIMIVLKLFSLNFISHLILIFKTNGKQDFKRLWDKEITDAGISSYGCA